MTSSPLTPLALGLGAVVADGAGHHRVAFYLVLLVLSSAVRANAAVGSSLPPLALSALVGCLGSYGLLGVVWLVWAPRPSLVRDL